mgnify:CR=1 FL=1
MYFRPLPFVWITAIALAIPNRSAAQADLFDAIADEHQLAGMSVVTRCGHEVSLEAHVGLRDIERKLPVNSETVFRMASISKAVVALCVAKLVESGTLTYDAPLSAYLDSPPVHPGHPNVPLTVQHLLTHTSGIRDGDGYGDFLSASYASIPAVPALSEVLSEDGTFYTTNMWGTSAPGEWFQYANLNFGVLATVMEAATGMRFDLLMDELIFAPFGLDAGYRVQQLDDINDVAVLYRQVNGVWTPQADQYEGVVPAGPNWEGYTPGNSAVCFSPQGGLRISARDLSLLAHVWTAGNAPGPDGTMVTFLSGPALSELHEQQWAYSASGGGNGNNYYGLFNSWGRGLHLAASGLGEDEVIPDVAVAPFIGHPGEAYGLISDAYSTPDGEWSFCFATHGKWEGYSVGPASAYYDVEQSVFAALRDDLLACLASSVPVLDLSPWRVLGQPRVGDSLLHLQGSHRGQVQLDLLRLDGRLTEEGVTSQDQSGRFTFHMRPLEFGWHVGRIQDDQGNVSTVSFFVGH